MAGLPKGFGSPAVFRFREGLFGPVRTGGLQEGTKERICRAILEDKGGEVMEWWLSITVSEVSLSCEQFSIALEGSKEATE